MIAFKAIKPGVKFKSSIFRDELRSAAEKMLPKVKKDFEKTAKTWNEKPKFEGEVAVGRPAMGRYLAGKIGITTGVMLAVITTSPIYLYVDEGTRVRYATMTPDFQPKTIPNWIGSRKGRGGMLFISKKRPRPGIKARNFTKIIHKTWQPLFRKEMAAAMKRAAERSGHGA